MRASVKFLIVCGEVFLFVLLAAAVALGAEFPPLKPTHVTAQQSSAASPYAATRPVRVKLTNKAGQVTTLEYHKAVKVVEEDRGELLPINELPVLSSPAREDDLDSISKTQNISYQHRVNYPTQAPVRYAYQSPVAAPAGPCAAPTTAYYPPSGQHPVQGYSAPGTSVPQTVYRPVMQVPVVSVVQTNVQVGSGIYGQPVIYRPGQPLRNVWRWLTP